MRLAPAKEINICRDANPCAPTAICTVQNKRATCKCPAGLIGDPFSNCFKETPALPECTSDSDCSSNAACIDQRCLNPCAERNPCALNAECRVSQHRPLCYCPTGWGGDPQLECYKRKYTPTTSQLKSKFTVFFLLLFFIYSRMSIRQRLSIR